MNPILEKKLASDFPALFRDNGFDPCKSCMAFGCDVGDGWEPLIRRACERLAALPVHVVLAQVKEKWGVLVIYTDQDGDDRVFEITQDAERESETVCEACGKPGTLRNASWVHVSCDDCEAARERTRPMW